MWLFGTFVIRALWLVLSTAHCVNMPVSLCIGVSLCYEECSPHLYQDGASGAGGVTHSTGMTRVCGNLSMLMLCFV